MATYFLDILGKVSMVTLSEVWEKQSQRPTSKMIENNRENNEIDCNFVKIKLRAKIFRICATEQTSKL